MTCTAVYTSDGMICDTRKRCSKGQCVADSTPEPENIDSDCVWGDQKTLEFTSSNYVGTCPAYLATYGAINCYVTPINESCCATCKNYNTGRVGCEYGDKSSECVKYTKASVCPTYGSNLCCGYCAGYVGKRSTNEDSAPVPDLYETITKPEVETIQKGSPYPKDVNAPHRR